MDANTPDADAPLLDEELAAFYEQMARERPRRYRATIAGLAVLGYAFVGAVFVCLVVAGLLLLRVRAAQAIVGSIACFWTALQVLRSFWVRRVESPGLVLAAEDAPALFAMVERLRSALDCRPPSRIVLDADCNASQDATRWGRRAGTMTIGLPLLLALPLEEVEAVVAHELGHVSRVHGAFNLWIYRVHGTWSRLAQLLGQGGVVAHLMGRFARWYFPRFAGCAQVLSRSFERHADREAARLTRPAVLASALARIHVTDSWMEEEFWPELSRRARAEADVAEGLFDRLAEALASPVPDLERRLREMLARRTMYWDTHPSLGERVAELGMPVPVLAPVAGTAAAALLGPAQQRLARATERAWFEHTGAAWQHHAAELGRSEERLRALDAGPSPGDVEADWERAQLTEQVHGPDAAVPHYRAVLAASPEHRRAQYALGRILLQRRDPAGEELVRASLLDPWLAPYAYQLLFEHLSASGRHDEAGRTHRLAAAHDEALQAAGPERSALTKSDVLSPHGLAEPELARLRAQLAGRAHLDEAYLVQKRVTRFPEKPCFVLGVVVRVAWYRPVAAGFVDTLVSQIASEVAFREPLLVVSLRDQRALLKKVRAVEDGRIFSARPDA